MTGAAGAIGSRVVGLLAADGVPVTALVRDARRAHPSATAAVVDYADPASLDAALRGVDTLVFIGSDGRADRVLAHHHNILRAATRRRRTTDRAAELAGCRRRFALLLRPRVRRHRGPSSPSPAPSRWSCGQGSTPSSSDAGCWTPHGPAELALPTRAAVAPIGRADVAQRPRQRCGRRRSAAGHDHRPGGVRPRRAGRARVPARRTGGQRHARSPPDEFRHRLIETGTDPWWSYAFTSLFDSIDQGRFAEVTPDFTAITGRAPAVVRGSAAKRVGPSDARPRWRRAGNVREDRPER